MTCAKRCADVAAVSRYCHGADNKVYVGGS
jgi:hypothetical protein